MEGRFEADALGRFPGCKWGILSTNRKAKRLIPGNFIFEGETHGFEKT